MVPAPSSTWRINMTFLDYIELAYYTTSALVTIGLLGYGLYLILDTIKE